MWFDVLAVHLADAVAQRRAQVPVQVAIIAIDGFGCCGKSTLAQTLAARTEALILETDDFQQPDGGAIEADSPLSYRRWAALQAAANSLALGQPARYAPINWDTHRLKPDVEVLPKPVLIIDGIGSHALRLPASPLRVFVDGRADSRMARVAARDGKDFANWDRYVAIELAYFRRMRPWRCADFYVLGAELSFANSAEGFARRLDSDAWSAATRLNQPFRLQAGNTPVDK